MGWREDHIYDRLQGKPHLIPVFTNVYRIPERLKELDENFFVVFNTKKQMFEIHSLANKGDTYGITIPLQELDARVFPIVRRANLRVRGKEIFREIDRHNERLKKSNERRNRDEIRALAGEVKSAFAKMAWR